MSVCMLAIDHSPLRGVDVWPVTNLPISPYMILSFVLRPVGLPKCAQRSRSIPSKFFVPTANDW